MENADFDHEKHLLACARGDCDALAAIYAHESRWLMGVALRIVRRRELADEVLHDSFIQIWQKSSSYQPALGSARGWIYSVVRHRAIHILRSGAHEIAAPDTEAHAAAAEEPMLSDALVARHEARALHRCLEVLDEPKRACILLAYVDGYSHNDIATQLGQPLGTVKSWVRRSLKLLKDCLS